ncbi:hypothetical protein [Thalassobacillus sp. C254]|uniref:hypothetical protein n=1 Tax=Thalassobacillus sp. C254 TaxID=1225341 RepID=UPI0006D25FEF|nr:hypothetical protein [Thalassobacillus sp. C254]
MIRKFQQISGQEWLILLLFILSIIILVSTVQYQSSVDDPGNLPAAAVLSMIEHTQFYNRT